MNKATSNTKIKRVLNELGSNTEINKRDSSFRTKAEIVILHPTELNFALNTYRKKFDCWMYISKIIFNLSIKETEIFNSE